MIRIFIISLILLDNWSANCQNFTLNDTTFNKGDVLSRNINFSFSGTNTRILDQSKPFLDSLSLFLKKFPDITIEIGNYIDQRGNEDFNLTITQKRAESIKYYLIQKGVNKLNLKSVGYGEQNPIYTNQDYEKATFKEAEKMHIANRRTEFKLIRIPYKSFEDSIYNKGDLILAPEIHFTLEGGARVRESSIDSVKVIADFLKANPEVNIEIGTHTDSRGSDNYNLYLSEKRSMRVLETLVDEFEIDPARIAIKGYGESKLRVTDAQIENAKTEEEKQKLHGLNRRVEIKIL